MSKADHHDGDDDMRADYDFSDGVRGKYVKRFSAGTNVMILEPDVAEHFKTSEEVNRVLREIAEKEAS